MSLLRNQGSGAAQISNESLRGYARMKIVIAGLFCVFQCGRRGKITHTVTERLSRLCRHRSMSSVRLVLLGALLLPIMLRAQANLPDVPEANPARPTVSTPATLTPVGYLQFEDGGLYATDSPEFSRRLGVNQVYKLTLDKRVELLTLFEPFTHSTGAAVSGNRPGEVFAGVQAVILPGKGERPTISGQYLRRLYASPAPELDLGTFVQSATILLSDDLHGFHFDVNGL